MLRDGNVIGQNVAKFRYREVWTQDVLAAKMQLLGRHMTRDIVANIESRRTAVTDKQIAFFTEVFGVEAGELFP